MGVGGRRYHPRRDCLIRGKGPWRAGSLGTTFQSATKTVYEEEHWGRGEERGHGKRELKGCLSPDWAFIQWERAGERS